MDLLAKQPRFGRQQYSMSLVLCLSGYLILGSTPGWASEVLPAAPSEAETEATTSDAAINAEHPAADTAAATEPALPAEDEAPAVTAINVAAMAASSSRDAAASSPAPATTVEEWLAQSLVTITGVRVEETEAGLQIVLETAGGDLTAPVTQAVGDALITEIPNAVLDLSEGEAFEQFGPAEGIALVSVVNMPDDGVRVSITGADGPPQAEVSTDAGNLVLSVVPGVATAANADEAIQVVVTGEQDEGYNPSSATTATRTDTPLRDIPQSIQVVPQEVIRDQRATTPNEALQNVPGVSLGADPPRTLFNGLLIRGFDASENVLTNGLQDPTNRQGIVFSNIERVEVLKGPASVLFGQGTVGGVVNYVTRQPLTEPLYSLEASVGNFDLYSGALDLSGPLNEQETVLYRLNGFVETNESFVDFVDQQRYQIAPVLTWQISDQTELTVEADYSQVDIIEDFGIPAAGTVLPNPNGEIPLSRFVGEPDDQSQTSVFRVGYDLEHRFNDNWQLRSAFKFSEFNYDRITVFPLGLEEDLRTLNRGFADQVERDSVYNLDNYVIGEFSTGSIQHQLLAGFNLYRRDQNLSAIGAFDAAPLDIFDPVYGIPPTGENTFEIDRDTLTQSLGLYVQDQIDLTDNLIVLLGGRFDIASQDVDNLVDGSSNFNQEEAFSPRVGIVYQPVEPISLYGSFTRSFQVADPSSSISGSVEPERGTQYEIGIKGDISDRLSATLAFYHLTRTNVETTDPENPLFTIQTGEQRSRGIELNVSGEILPGWNVIAGYAYTDAEITEDNDLPVGNTLPNVPEHAFNFWTTYTLQNGSLEGLGFGLGLFFEGDRQGDIDNSFVLPSYLRTDAAIFYERDRLRAAINFKNLFDNEFFVFSASDTRVSPGDPFSIIGSVSFEF